MHAGYHEGKRGLVWEKLKKQKTKKFEKVSFVIVFGVFIINARVYFAYSPPPNPKSPKVKSQIQFPHVPKF
jgi:hypothetical protein